MSVSDPGKCGGPELPAEEGPPGAGGAGQRRQLRLPQVGEEQPGEWPRVQPLYSLTWPAVPTHLPPSSNIQQSGSAWQYRWLPSSAVNWSLAGLRSRSGRAGRRGGSSQQTGRSRRCSGRKEGQGAGRAGPRLATDWARARAGGPVVLQQTRHIQISQHFFRLLLILAQKT